MTAASDGHRPARALDSSLSAQGISALAMPALANNGLAAGAAGNAGGDPNAPLIPEERAVCRRLGMSEQAFIQSRAADLRFSRASSVPSWKDVT